METMYTDRSGGRVRRLQRSIEELLLRLPVAADLRDYAMWVTSDPGLNLRNDGGHGLLEKGRCHEVLGAHVVYLTIALAYANLA